MKDLECSPEIDTASEKLVEMKKAISKGNYAVLQELLLHQTLFLQQIGVEFVQMSAGAPKMTLKRAYMEIALRSFTLSQKAAVAVKNLKS